MAVAVAASLTGRADIVARALAAAGTACDCRSTELVADYESAMSIAVTMYIAELSNIVAVA